MTLTHLAGHPKPPMARQIRISSQVWQPHMLAICGLVEDHLATSESQVRQVHQVHRISLLQSHENQQSNRPLKYLEMEDSHIPLRGDLLSQLSGVGIDVVVAGQSWKHHGSMIYWSLVVDNE